MWIVSQGRKGVVNADKVESVFLREVNKKLVTYKKYFVDVMINNTSYTLGEYNTEEIAVTVIEELTKRMSMYDGTAFVFYMPLQEKR